MKKTVSLLCAAAMGLSLFTGCSERPADKQNAEELLSAAVEGSITVTCYDTTLSKNFLDNAAALFEAQYPGTQIQVESFSEMPEVKTMESGDMKLSMVTMEDDSQGKADYISKINTELMSGKGADVIAIDILPWYRYAEGGQLVDLKPYMEADAEYNTADYHQHLIDGVMYEGGQYFIPLDYNFDFYCYDTTLFSEAEAAQITRSAGLTYADLTALGEGPFAEKNANAQTPTRMLGISPLQLLETMLKTHYASFIDIPNRKANFNDGSFAGLLETVKDYMDKNYIQGMLTRMSEAEMASASASLEEMMSSGGLRQQVNEAFFFKQQNAMSLLNLYNTNPQGNVMMVTSGGAGLSENDAIAGLAQNADGQYPYQFSQAYGMNANSENKRLAWEFIKFLLGNEAQTAMMLVGQPMNIAAQAEKARMNITGALFDPSRSAETLDAQQQAVYDAYLSALNQFTAQLNWYSLEDSVIQQTVNDEAERFFAGEQSADEAAAAIQNKVSLYLGE